MTSTGVDSYQPCKQLFFKIKRRGQVVFNVSSFLFNRRGT